MKAKTILCIDDNETALRVRRMLLESKGYRVLTASTAEAGTESVDSQVDLVILDYRLADGNSEQLSVDLKRRWPSLPILLLSGYPNVPDSAKFAADTFLTKGGLATELLAAVESLLDRKANP